MPPLRILMVSADYPPALNGYAIQCAATANALAMHGCAVRVLTAAGDFQAVQGGASRLGVLRSALPEERISLSPRYLRRQFHRAAAYRANIAETELVLDAFQPDVVIVWQFAELGIGLLEPVAWRGIPVLLNVEDYSLATVVGLLRDRRGVLGRIRRWLYAVDPDELPLEHLAVVSGTLRDHYLAHGFPAASMTVLHNAMDAGEIADAPAYPAGGRLIFAGRLHQTKGVELALAALAQVNAGRRVPLTLDLVGSGTTVYEQHLRVVTRRLGLEPHVRFLGRRDRREILAMYCQYDLALFPSIWHEPFGLSVIEAMAQGTPVVALDRGGPSEIITHGVDGLLVPGESPEAYAAAIASLADDAPRRHDMAGIAIATVRSRFTMQRHVERTLALLETLTRRPDTRAAARTGSRG